MDGHALTEVIVTDAADGWVTKAVQRWMPKLKQCPCCPFSTFGTTLFQNIILTF